MSTGSYIKLTEEALSFGWRFTFTKLYNMGLRHKEITIDFTAKIKPGPYYNTCFEIFFCGGCDFEQNSEPVIFRLNGDVL
jgi:hypothetical protein